METTDLRIHEKDLELLEKYLKITISSFEDGACFFTTDLDKVTFKLSHIFDIAGLDEGTKYSKSGVAAKVIEAGKITTMNLERSVYGVRVLATGGPVWNETNTEIVGAWILAQPRQHEIVKAFDSFAYVLANALPEGGVVWVADREKYVKRQASEKFDMPSIQLGGALREGSVQFEAMRTKKIATMEVAASVFGVPVRGIAAPLINEENGEVVGTFGLALPRQLATDLKLIANSLDEGLAGVSAAIEQITVATQETNHNQQDLNDEIDKVKNLVEKINEVMLFIRSIADETKMLGLNASIEAARAGQAGLGFGVVAQEIRKLSEESRKTVGQIQDLTQQINLAMSETAGASQSTMAVVEETAAATQETNASIDEMTNLAQKLARTAENL